MKLVSVLFPLPMSSISAVLLSASLFICFVCSSIVFMKISREASPVFFLFFLFFNLFFLAYISERFSLSFSLAVSDVLDSPSDAIKAGTLFGVPNSSLA